MIAVAATPSHALVDANGSFRSFCLHRGSLRSILVVSHNCVDNREKTSPATLTVNTVAGDLSGGPK